MDLFNKEIIIALTLFGRGEIDPKQLREYLAGRFFSEFSEKPLDHLLIGEIEGALSEFERGDRELISVRKIATDLKNSAILLIQQLGLPINQEPVFALI